MEIAKSAQFIRTRSALLVSSLLNEPLACLFIWLPFILRKDCQALAWHLSLLATLKPIVAVFSFYWSRSIQSLGFNHRWNFLMAGVLARIPFLLFPFFQSIGFALFASGVYLFFSRAGLPSWMETVKLNLEPVQREKWFSLSSMLGYAEGILVAFLLGTLFDRTFSAWRYLFALTSFIGIIAVFYQFFVTEKESKKPEFVRPSYKFLLIEPLKEAFSIMKRRKDFALFQWGFMSGGFGIMLANVISPLFFVDILNLKHVDYAYARYIYMGIGFILFSPIWQKGMQKASLFALTMRICFGFALFIFCLVLSSFHLFWLNIAFFCYGASQAGSHLVWHLSGPYFSNEEDSSGYSAVNLMMVGFRGLIGPALGSLLYAGFGPFVVFGIAFFFCLTGGALMIRKPIPFDSKNVESL